VTLRDQLEAGPVRKPGGCALGRIMDALSVEDREALQAALDEPRGSDDRFTNLELTLMLQQEGFEIHLKTVETHRKGGCSCEHPRAPE